jgi:DNA-binding transcriptional MerR regulator
MDLMSPLEVHKLTGIPVETLRYWRNRRVGPVSFKLGRKVVYDRADVERWVAAQRRAAKTRLNTADYTAAEQDAYDQGEHDGALGDDSNENDYPLEVRDAYAHGYQIGFEDAT